jgi:glycosyltransferase involved in cell wall biosynthesis
MHGSRRRRLLIVSQPLDGGVPRHVLDLVQLLDGDHYEIDVACPRASLLWSYLQRRSNVQLHEIASNRAMSRADGQSWRRLLALVRRADLIHAHSSKAGFLTRFAVAALGRTASCVFTPHGWSFWAVGGAEARFYRALERVAARWCRTILAVSDYEYRNGLANGIGRPAQYRVVHNGIDLRRFAQSPAPVNGRIVMVGRLSAPKRQDCAVQAAAALRQQYPHLELLLVGDGPQRSQVEALVARLGLSRTVRLLGTRDDIPQLLSHASCLLLASDYEACPLAVIEAMAAGVPVVATRVGGVPEIVESGHSGLLVESQGSGQLARALAELLDDPHRARAMGDAGRRAAHERFSSTRMVTEIREVYEEVAAS